MSVVFRDDIGAYTGLGRKLTKGELDGNFYDLLLRVIALESGGSFGLDLLEFDGTHITFHWSDDTTSGPISLPVATFKAAGQWANGLVLTYLDVVSVPGTGTFLVQIPHTTPAFPAEFDPSAENDSGDPLYLQIAESVDSSTFMKFLGDWLTGTVYEENDVVTESTYGLFLSLAAHTADPTFDPLREDDSVPIYKWLAAPPFEPIDTVAGATYEISAADIGKYLRFTQGCLVTFPEIADMPLGARIRMRQCGDEDVVFQPEDELVVTVNPQHYAFSASTPWKGAVIEAKYVGTNEWDLIGPSGAEVSA